MSDKSIMLTYLGNDIGEQGCFGDATKWFGDGSKLLKPQYTIVDADVEELKTTSDMMRDAIVEPFPIPEFRFPAHPLTGEEVLSMIGMSSSKA